MPPNDPISNIQAKRQQQAQFDTEEARNQSIIDAVTTTGKDTKDSLTASMHDILMATMIGKDPRIVEVAENLSELLQSIATASDDMKNSGLKEVKGTFKKLLDELSDLPAKVAATDQSKELIPFIQGVEKAIREIRVNPNVTVNEREQNLKPVIDILKSVEKAIKDNKVKVDLPKQDDKELLDAVQATTRAIKELSFPVPNYVLPYRNNQGAATQVSAVTSSSDSTKIGIVALNPDGSNISGGGGGGGGTQYAEGVTTAPATGTVALGRYNTSSPTLTNGQLNAPQLDVNSNLKVIAQSNSGVDIGDVTINNASGASAVNIQDGGNSITVDGTVAATQSGTWSTRTQDGSGNAITSTSNALDVNIKTNAAGSTLSTNNSSSANIAGAGNFTGTGEDVTSYSEMRVSVYSSHASATDGLSIQQSSDNTNWDIIDTYTIPATTGKTFVVPRQARYFRVVYTNGATLTTSFRLQTILNRTGASISSQRASDAYTNETDLEQSQAFNMLYNGTTWDRIRGDTTNGLDVDVTRMSALVAGSATVGFVGVNGSGTTSIAKLEDVGHSTGDMGVFALAVRNDNAATSVTNANADYSQFAVDITGTEFVRQSPANTATTANVAASATSVTALAANAARRYAIFYNDSTSDCYIKYGTTASSTSFTYYLPSLGTLSIEGAEYAGRVDVIHASATGNLRVTETTI